MTENKTPSSWTTGTAGSAAQIFQDDCHIEPPALVAYMTATTTPERDAAFLRTYAARVRNGTAATWEIPNTVATTLEDIADRILKAQEDGHGDATG